jgi:hypothetical protein
MRRPIMPTVTKLDNLARDKVRSMSPVEFAAWCDSAEGKEWSAERELLRQREHELETSKLVASVQTKLRAAGYVDVAVVAATAKDLDGAQDETEWNLSAGAVVDGSYLVCRHRGDPTHGDFGTSFVVFARCGRRWDKNAIVLGCPDGRPYNWGGRTTKSLEQALGVICGATAQNRMRGKRRTS